MSRPLTRTCTKRQVNKEEGETPETDLTERSLISRTLKVHTFERREGESPVNVFTALCLCV